MSNISTVTRKSRCGSVRPLNLTIVTQERIRDLVGALGFYAKGLTLTPALFK